MQSIKNFIGRSMSPTAKPVDAKHPPTSSVAPGRAQDAKTSALDHKRQLGSAEPASQATHLSARSASLPAGADGGATEGRLARLSEFGGLAQSFLRDGGVASRDKAAPFEKLLATAAEEGTPPTYRRDVETHRALQATQGKLQDLPGASALSAQGWALASAAFTAKLEASTERMAQYAPFERERGRLARELTGEVLQQVSEGRMSDAEAATALGAIARHLIEGGPKGHAAVKEWSRDILQDSRLSGGTGMNRVRDMTRAVVGAVANVLRSRDPQKPVDAARKEAAGDLKAWVPGPDERTGGDLGVYERAALVANNEARATILIALDAEIAPDPRSLRK